MIELLTGVPGSGKSYFATHRLKEEYDKRSRPIFTNLNLKIPYDDVLQPLDINEFHQFCKDELAYFQKFRDSQSSISIKSDDFEDINNDPLNYDEELKKSGLLDKFGNALILWDECQNDLSDLDDAYLRFMSYHRHFEGMDVLLITQNLSLIHRKYKGFIDKYFFGQNAAKRLLSSTFKYKVYTDHREYSKYHIEDISLSSDKKIFALYDSGFYKVSKSALLKKMAPISLLLVVLALLILYFFHHLKSDVKQDLPQSLPGNDDPTSVSMTSDQQQLQKAVNDYNNEMQQQNADYLRDQNSSDTLMPPPPLQHSNGDLSGGYSNQSTLKRQFVRFTCTNDYCYFSANRFTLPTSSLNTFITEYGGKILFAEKVTRDLVTVSAVVPSELYYMIQSHNTTSRSDTYAGSQAFSGGNALSTPQFVPNQGI